LKICKAVYISLVLLLGLTACGRPPLVANVEEGDGLAGRAAWSRMVQLKTLKATAVLSWRSTDGTHGKYKVRLSLAPPEHLKIEWLTPWGSVAGQLIIVADQFWFSDSRQRLTWYGLRADLRSLFQRNENRSWESATQFFMYWPQLFSTAQEDDETFGVETTINYLTTDGGRYLNKIINFKDGDEMHIRLDDLVPVADGRLFPRTLEALSHGGQIALALQEFTLQKELDPKTFIYSLKNFNLRECSVYKGDIHDGE